MNTLTRGDLASLRWIESDLRLSSARPANPRRDLCRVYYAPLNFRDIMLATGKLPPDALPGNLAGQVRSFSPQVLVWYWDNCIIFTDNI